jgi:hypothetical protein
MSTGHPAGQTPWTARGRWLAWAWAAVALIPVFFVLALATGQGVYALMGYRPENADAPVAVVLVALVPTLAVALVPCVAAVLAGRRAVRAGQRGGTVPLVLGALTGLGLLVLTVVSELGNAVRG